MKNKQMIFVLFFFFFVLFFSNPVFATTASEGACYRQCLYDAGWREDEPWLGSINLHPACTARCCEGFCCSKCYKQCKAEGNLSFACTDNCEWNCFKDITEPCRDSCQAKDPNTDFFMIDGECSCMCKNGFNNSGGSCVEGKKPANEDCIGNEECGDGLFCFDEKCTSSDGADCKKDHQCGTGAKCIDKVCVLQFEDKDKCKTKEDCKEGEKCENEKCVSETLGLSIQISKTEVLLKEGQPVVITAVVSGPKRASVTFDINDPDFLFSQGKLTKRKSIDDSGKAQTTINFPAFNEIKIEKRDYLPYSMAVTVTAESGDQRATASGKITLLSPAPKITSVQIKPTPVKAYNEYLILVQIEDPDSSEFQYFFKPIGGGKVSELDDSAGANKVGMLIVDSSSKSASVNYFSSEMGFNANEILMAQEMEGTLKGGAKSLGFTIAKAGGEKLVKDQFESKFFLLLQKRGAKYVPIIGTVKSLYGLWGNMQSSGQKFLDLIESATWKEGIYRGLDLTAEGVKFTAGAADLIFGDVPVIGNLADLTQDAIDTAVSAGQGYLKQLAEEERFDASELRTTPNFVTIKVRDKDGFMDSETLTFELEYYWVNN